MSAISGLATATGHILLDSAKAAAPIVGQTLKAAASAFGFPAPGSMGGGFKASLRGVMTDPNKPPSAFAAALRNRLGGNLAQTAASANLSAVPKQVVFNTPTGMQPNAVLGGAAQHASRPAPDMSTNPFA